MNDLKTLNEIFQNNIYRIPDYQRGYAWTLKELKDFWEDLVNLQDTNKHYTGMLAITPVDKKTYSSWAEEQWLINNKSYKPYYIVDGQQRLTTSVIFIQCLLKTAKEKNPDNPDIYIEYEPLKNYIKQYIVEEKPNSHIKTYKFGYENDNPNYEYLKNIIFEEGTNENCEASFYTLNLLNAKTYFLNCLEKYYNDYKMDGLARLLRNITQKFMYNIYKIDDEFDIFVCFETMNNRGKPLSKLELLKNRLIYLCTLFPENKNCSQDDKIVLRKDINKAWKEIYNQLGKKQDGPLNADEFLKAHWITYFKYSRNKGDDYIKYLLEEKFVPKNVYENYYSIKENIQEVEEIEDTDMLPDEDFPENETDTDSSSIQKITMTEIKDYITSLQKAALHWYNTFYPTASSNKLSGDEKKWLDKLNRLGIAYFRPLILASYMNASISQEEKVKLLKAIERFIFLAFRVGRAAANYKSSQFYRSARELKNNEITIDELCDELNKLVDSWLMKDGVFVYDSFKNDYLLRHENLFYDWNGLKYFLYEYEYEKFEEKGNKKILDWQLFIRNEKDEVSIEHIYPQTADNQYWLDHFKDTDDEEKSFLTNSLGNLLPLSQSVNSSLQNVSYTEKVKGRENFRGYNEGSYSEIEVANTYPDWEPENILQRGYTLLEFMERRWNIKFKDKNAKKDLLCLNFIQENTSI